MSSKKLALAAIALLTSALSPPGFGAGLPRYNEVFRVATHNSYWVKRDPGPEAFASGVQERLLDQLLMDHARGLEIDIHKDDTHPHQWTVYHTDKQSNSFCSPFVECLKQLRQFHYALPEHEVVTVVIELKEILEHNFDTLHTPADLDRLLEDHLGPALYRPRDFLARCAPGATLRQCARPEAAGWPTTRELRGKFIFTVLGNWRWCTIGHGASGWAEYATWGGGAAERSAFPMESDFGNFTREHCGDEYIPPATLAAAQAASVFLQVENVGDPKHMEDVAGFLAEGRIVRGHDSFSVADQAARVAAGFQLLQTDHPWLQYGDQGPARPFRPLRPADFPDESEFDEPGDRVLLVPPPVGVYFPAERETSPWVEWETLPSSTRPATNAAYPNPRAPRGKGCLRASAGAGSAARPTDLFQVCRRTVEGHWYRPRPLGENAAITVELSHAGHRRVKTFYAGARTAQGGIGDQLRLAVWTDPEGHSCAAAFSASEIGADGRPEWTYLASDCFASRLEYQGLAASGGEVLFIGTRRIGDGTRREEAP